LSKPFEDMDLLRILSLYLNIDRERVLA